MKQCIALCSWYVLQTAEFFSKKFFLEKEQYLVSKIVLTYCKKKCSIDLEKTFEIRSLRPRICKNFEITKALTKYEWAKICCHARFLLVFFWSRQLIQQLKKTCKNRARQIIFCSFLFCQGFTTIYSEKSVQVLKQNVLKVSRLGH